MTTTCHVSPRGSADDRHRLAARLRSRDPLAGDARRHPRAGRGVAAERARIATEGWGARLLELQAPDGLWAGIGLVARLDGHVPRPGAAPPVRARSGKRAGPSGDRARPRARHLGRRRTLRRPLGRTTVLRRRGRAVHQRHHRRERRVFRRGHDPAGRPPHSASSSPTAAGTARSRTAPPCRRSGPRSTSSRGCSSTNGRSAARPRSPRPAGVARSTCSSAACSAGSRPAR